jgi:hypothetical protein
MQITLEKSVFEEALNAVQLKGKWFSTSGMSNDTLGNLVKIVAKSDGSKKGYHFINANNQTFVDYWIPAEVENKSWAVIDILKAQKYLKTMPNEEVTLEVSDSARFFTFGKMAEFPTYNLHSNEGACDSFFRASMNVTPENEIEWGEFPIKSGFIIPVEVLKHSIKSCENVKHGVYKLMLDGGMVEISSSNGPSERYAENFEPIACWGEPATVEYTGPIHTAFKSGLVNCHFNDDSLLVMQNSNLLIARAPYVVV